MASPSEQQARGMVEYLEGQFKEEEIKNNVEYASFCKTRSELVKVGSPERIKDKALLGSGYEMQEAFTYKLAKLYNACLQEIGTPQPFTKWEEVESKESCKKFGEYVVTNFKGAFSAEELWSEQEHLGDSSKKFMVCFHAKDKNKQYLIPLDLHWTHSNVVAYGMGADTEHNRINAMSFLNSMQAAVKTYQASKSAFKNTGPTGFNALGGRMGVFFTHLRLQSENPPAVVTIDQIIQVLQREMEIRGETMTLSAGSDGGKRDSSNYCNCIIS